MKTEPKRKLQRLMNGYPAIAVVLDREKFAGQDAVLQRISVQKADPTLMYAQAHNCDGIGHCVMGMDDRKGLSASCNEYALVIDEFHRIISEERWEERERHVHYVRGALDRLGSDIKRVHYLLWVTVMRWHKDDDSRQHVDTTINVVVCLRPDGGFTKLLREADLFSNVHLNKTDHLTGILKKDPTWTTIDQRLSTIGTAFRTQVFSRGLSRLIADQDWMPMSGTFGDVELMSLAMAGRLMFTFRSGDSDFTLIGEDSESTGLGVQSVYATLSEVKRMVDAVIGVWEATAPDDRAGLYKRNDKVGFGM